MGPQHKKLSFRITHPTRDLSPVCAALGMVPARIWKSGEERTTPKGTRVGGIRDHSYCSIAFGESSKAPLNEKIAAALSVLKPQRALLRELTHTGGALSFFVGVFCDDNTGESLSGALLEAMADLGIGLDLDIYVPERAASGGLDEQT